MALCSRCRIGCRVDFRAAGRLRSTNEIVVQDAAPTHARNRIPRTLGQVIASQADHRTFP